MNENAKPGIEALPPPIPPNARGGGGGIVFIGSALMDLNFEAVEWTRLWIKKVGETRL